MTDLTTLRASLNSGEHVFADTLAFIAAGYAPDFHERPLDSPEMASMRAIVEHVLKGHEPYPALAVDRHHHPDAADHARTQAVEGGAAARHHHHVRRVARHGALGGQRTRQRQQVVAQRGLVEKHEIDRPLREGGQRRRRSRGGRRRSRSGGGTPPASEA